MTRLNHSNYLAGGGPELTPLESGQVCILANSTYFFINHVFIVYNCGTYRLLALHRGRVLIDKDFDTEKGAKIAFSKFFGYRCWRENQKTQWTIFYEPDEEWLDEMRLHIKDL